VDDMENGYSGRGYTRAGDRKPYFGSLRDSLEDGFGVVDEAENVQEAAFVTPQMRELDGDQDDPTEYANPGQATSLTATDQGFKNADRTTEPSSLAESISTVDGQGNPWSGTQMTAEEAASVAANAAPSQTYNTQNALSSTGLVANLLSNPATDFFNDVRDIGAISPGAAAGRIAMPAIYAAAGGGLLSLLSRAREAAGPTTGPSALGYGSSPGGMVGPNGMIGISAPNMPGAYAYSRNFDMLGQHFDPGATFTGRGIGGNQESWTSPGGGMGYDGSGATWTYNPGGDSGNVASTGPQDPGVDMDIAVGDEVEGNTGGQLGGGAAGGSAPAKHAADVVTYAVSDGSASDGWDWGNWDWDY